MEHAGTTEPISCTCSAEAVTRGSVWGMDHYTGDSAICRAALHAGVIGPRGGPVSVVPEPGRSAYPGVTRNGVESINYGFFRSGFRFAAGAGPAPAPSAAGGNSATASQAGSSPPAEAVSMCPDNFMAFAGTTEPLHCTCSAEGVARGAVWGVDHYTGDSSVCRAALHAGIVSRDGGSVTVLPEPGRASYPGSTRNGVESIRYGAFASGYRFSGGVGK